jgi:hypothetical protein
MQNRTDRPADQRTAAPDRPESPNAPQATAATATVPPAQADEGQLLPGDVLQEFRESWERIQTGFVDQPRESVQSAHDLVGQLVERLSQSFARQRDGLEGTWSRGADVSTEDLRLALQRYRSFFDRLLST